MSLIEIVIGLFIFAIAISVVIVALTVSTKQQKDNADETAIRLTVSNNAAYAKEIIKTPLQNDGWTLNRNGEFSPRHGDGFYVSLLECRFGSEQFSYIVATEEDPVGNSFLNLDHTQIASLSPGSYCMDLRGDTGIVNNTGQIVPGITFVNDSTFVSLPRIYLVQQVRATP